MKAWTAKLDALQNEVCAWLGVDEPDDDAEVLEELHRLGAPVERVEIGELIPFLHIQAVGFLVRYRHLREFAAGIGQRGLGIT